MTRLRVDICTVIAKNYLAHARVLAESFSAKHPQGTCHVLILDEYEGYLDPGAEPFELITPAELQIEGFEEMAAAYDVLELSTAVKPWLLRTLLERTPGAGIVYLDPDIEVFGSLDPVEELMREHGLVLIPHVTAPMPRDGRKPSETDILIAGAYNLGFIGLGNDEAAQELLDWWSERLRTDCRVDPERGYFVDQRWMDFAPGIVESLEILRDPGYDVAYWNLPSRRLARVEGDWTVNGEPLRFFHYSGYDPDNPNELSRHQDRIRLRDDPLVAELCNGYRHALLRHGYREAQRWEYSYGRLANGVKLDTTMRRMLPDALEEGVGDSLFTREAGDAFLGWLKGSAGVGAAHGINRYLQAVHDRRPDLQRAYPNLDGPDGERYAGWARVYGPQDVPIPEELLPPPPHEPLPDGSTARQGPGVEAGRPRHRPDAEARRWGVNVIGYLHSELGIGEAARQVITALDAGGIRAAPVGLVAPLSRQGQVFAAGEAGDLPYAVNLVCVNADGLPGFVAEVGTEWRRDRYSIGLWFWEVSGFPEIFEPSFEMVNEVWVASEHVAGALRPKAPVPITKVTVPIEPLASGLLNRERLGLPGGPLFLFSFDYHSIFARKNPLGLVDAYKRAFPATGEATLVLKSINHEKHATSHQDIAAATADRPDILILDRYVSLQEKDSLVAACDCYVSLHRSEGLGLTMGEAMYYGKPVIATGYSGNLDFMTEDNSLLVGHRLVPIGPGAEPYPADGEWAEPDLDEAARHMRWVVEHWEEARALGARASASIRESHSAHAAGKTMARRLTEVRPSLPSPSTTGSFAAELMGGMGTGHIRQRVRAGARTQGAVRGPRSLARDAVLRAIQPFTAHEHAIDESIASLIDEHLEATRRGLEEANRRAIAGDAAVRAQLRGMDRALRAEVAALNDDLVRRSDHETRLLGDHETRLRRIEPERPGAERWPPETPWSHAYVAAHRSLVSSLLDDTSVLRLFANNAALPPGFGVGFDERVVEYPWVFAQRLGGRALDAGSVMNHAHVLQRFRPLVTELTIATLVSESPTLPDAAVRYDDADLRELPYPDGSFDTVLCLSTLEHVGMDNAQYGSEAPRADDPRADALRGLAELRRVTAPGGRLLVTMPYGEPEDRGWVRQADREEAEALVEAARPCEARVGVYRYQASGWKRSTLEEAADARYRDYLDDPRPVEDLAAAARAVVCIALTCR